MEDTSVRTTAEAFSESGNSPPAKKVNVQQQKFRLHTISDLKELPPPEWLIEDILGLNTFAVIYSRPGEGKSFVALDMALSVASGQPWQSRATKKKATIYVVAEGGRGITQRVNAWLKHKSVAEVDGAFFLLEAPQLHRPEDQKRLIPQLKSIPDVGLVVLDTLASSFVSGDENSAQDMGKWIDGARRIQRETGATVLVVHHVAKPSEGHSKKLERGSGALRGAADTMIELTAKAGVITLTCSKQKDAECFAPIKMNLECFAIDEASKPTKSCVPVGAEGKSNAGPPRLNQGEQKTLDALAGLDGMATSATWRQATGFPEKTFHNHRKSLVEKGYAEKSAALPHLYQLTDAGAASAKPLPLASQDTRPTETAATATPL
jgi:hypothetical protein